MVLNARENWVDSHKNYTSLQNLLRLAKSYLIKLNIVQDSEPADPDLRLAFYIKIFQHGYFKSDMPNLILHHFKCQVKGNQGIILLSLDLYRPEEMLL